MFFKRLIQNLLQGPATEPYPPAEAETPETLRARITYNPDACTLCRMCEYVCAGKAIRFEEDDKGVTFNLWHNTCAFCGLCAHAHHGGGGDITRGCGILWYCGARCPGR